MLSDSDARRPKYDPEPLETALREILQWSESYPPKIFPEPDWAKAAELLKAGGMTLDSISAYCLRHALEGVGKIARNALSAANRENRDDRET